MSVAIKETNWTNLYVGSCKVIIQKKLQIIYFKFIYKFKSKSKLMIILT